MYKQMDTVEVIFKELMYYMGFSGFEVKTIHAQLDPSIYINFGFKIDYQDIAMLELGPRAFIDKVYAPLIKQIQESDAVNDAKAELTAEINDLKEKLEAVTKEVTRLQDFEKYYNLAYKMEHGQ